MWQIHFGEGRIIAPLASRSVDGDADIATLAALIGDRTRARVLLALGDGRALAASVLAGEAGVSAATISGHLKKLVHADLLVVESHGRHRYYRLAGPHVGRLLETLAEHARPAPVTSLREGTRAHAVRQGRYCYDHVGGRLGVALMRGLTGRGFIAGGNGRFDPERVLHDRLSAPGNDVDYHLTDTGADWVRRFGIDLDALTTQRRQLIRYCTDWSEQRHHLAGALGAAIAERLLAQDWIERAPSGRAVRLTDTGRQGLNNALGIDVDDYT